MVSQLLDFPFKRSEPSYRTLVGSGLKLKSKLRRPLNELIPQYIAHIAENVQSFNPSGSSITTSAGRTLSYETLVVATGLQVNFDQVEGLPRALDDPSSNVSTIYSYSSCDNVWKDIEGLQSGRAIFTQPAGVIKCAGGQSSHLYFCSSVL